MPIDTLKAAKRLQEDDTFSPEQAERIAEILSDLENAIHRRDTRTYPGYECAREPSTRLHHRLDEFEANLTQRIGLWEERLGAKIEKTRTQLLQWMLASVTGVATIVAAMVALINYLMG